MFKFRPILKPTIWGGEKIITFKQLESEHQPIGESWEISDVSGYETFVSEGEYVGKSLKELVSLLGEKLLGTKNYLLFGNEFPLLVKFIDAYDNLSIQVHPDDITAQRHGKKCGKTEMWYVMESDKGAQLYNGLRCKITSEEYKQKVANGTICDALAHYEVHEGDVFFIPAGRIHSIGKGCFVTEIQQTSDITYRIFDYKRRDKNGAYRQLHTLEAEECIDFNVLSDYRTHYNSVKNEGVQLVQCPYFTISIYDLDMTKRLDYSNLESFVILVGVKGQSVISDDQGNSTTLNAGETVLFPATTKYVNVNGKVKFLETYV